MARAPPRLPLDLAPHRSLRAPPVPCIKSPTVGFTARKSSRSRRSVSVNTRRAADRNSDVSTTVWSATGTTYIRQRRIVTTASLGFALALMRHAGGAVLVNQSAGREAVERERRGER